MTNLSPLTFRPFTPGHITPQGWLAQQLQIQASGLSGHLDEFWPDIRDSAWFGGQAEGWERAPYWLDGLVPLAYLLQDQRLIAKVRHCMDEILTRQQPNGWLGPGHENPKGYDIWALFLILKPLMTYFEASGDERAIIAIEKGLRCIDQHIDASPLFNWGQFRWFEALLPIYWLAEKQPAPWLFELAVKLQAQGFDWPSFFQRWPFRAATPKGRWNFMSHVVNNAMALKAPALWARLTGDPASRAATYDLFEQLDRCHGMASGIFTGDECLAGKRPTQGSELCSVVEYAFSLETLLTLTGDPLFGDRLEKVIFNALPATFLPDMWSHQYDQQANQVECSIRPDPIWITNRPDANIFGLEPDFGCCTANLHQGWPKFAAHLWMQPDGGGLAAVAYAPSQVTTAIDGVEVKASLQTNYPFSDTLNFTVSTAAPVQFPLLLRIPAWAHQAQLNVEGEEPVFPVSGSFYRLERTWSGETSFCLRLPMQPALWNGFNQAVAIERGPLVYALPIAERRVQVNAQVPGHEAPHADWELYPASPWNYALCLQPHHLDQSLTFTEKEPGECPFSPEGAPVLAHVKGRRLPEWQLHAHSAADAPLSPVTSSQPLEDLTLIPYGCTNLRITEFPWLDR